MLGMITCQLEKMCNLKTENYVSFNGFSEDLGQEDSLTDSSKELLHRSKFLIHQYMSAGDRESRRKYQAHDHRAHAPQKRIHILIVRELSEELGDDKYDDKTVTGNVFVSFEEFFCFLPV